MTKKYTSNRPIGGIKDNAGIGYVIIPRDNDKKQYIEHCFRTGTVSIVLENGGVIDNVLITKNALNEIDFPVSYKAKGSQLIWINQPRKNQPIAIGCISKTNEFVNFNKNKSSLRRSTKNFVSELLVDAENGVVVITSNSSIEGGGDIYIISTNKNKTSKMVLRVSGEINIASTDFFIENSKQIKFTIKDKDVDDEVTELFYEKGKGFSYKDEFGNEHYMNSDNIQFKPNKKFNLGDGNEPMMLSDTFKSIFNDFTDALSKLASQCAIITCPDSMGGTGVPNNASQFTQISSDLNQLKEKYKNFQSQQSFLD